ncbi:cobamide remodeling phosphodiesterase CbiR [Oleidesulfovibrio sp.]|uniref:cobamide remodeling phosphodiesterase CbiR n=1 Tax=Oleidesulfovibrio sp. TaxID=2909707 RepID=UPI003A8BC550
MDYFAGRLGEGRILAAPSWVIPAGVAENCRYLAGRVDEVGLLFFESEACLAYTHQDLPHDLAELPLRWHVHLPVDLPWGGQGADICSAADDGAAAARICTMLMDKVTFLGAGQNAVMGVVHPPAFCSGEYAAIALQAFAKVWTQSGRNTRDILLENIKGQSLLDLKDVVLGYDMSVCLDTGHLLAYCQHGLLGEPHLMQRIRMLHLNAEVDGGKHAPLTVMNDEEQQLCRKVLALAPRDCIVMMELFKWHEIEASLPLVETWLQESEG